MFHDTLTCIERVHCIAAAAAAAAFWVRCCRCMLAWWHGGWRAQLQLSLCTMLRHLHATCIPQDIEPMIHSSPSKCLQLLSVDTQVHDSTEVEGLALTSTPYQH
jgi:hypothetical protein